MSNLADQIARFNQPVDKALFRALSFILAIGHTGLVMWKPTQYAESIGGFNPLTGPLLIWAICSGVIFGIGFIPKNWYWKLLFSPYVSLGILLYLTFCYLFV